MDNLTYMMGAYWYLACDSLSRSATILAEDFQQVFLQKYLIKFDFIINVTESNKTEKYRNIILSLGSSSHWSSSNGS